VLALLFAGIQTREVTRTRKAAEASAAAAQEAARQAGKLNELTAEGVKAAQQAAEAARQSAEAATELSKERIPVTQPGRRARVVVQKADVNSPIGQTPSVVVTFGNVGTTSAVHFLPFVDFTVTETASEFVPSFNIAYTNNERTLEPGQTSVMPVKRPQPLPVAELEDLKSGKRQFLIWGWVTFTDMSGIRHAQRFCRTYRVDIGILASCAKYNDPS